MKDTIKYTSDNGYTGVLYGKSSLAIWELEDNPIVIDRKVLEQIRAEIDGIEINGQADEHTMFIRTGEQVKQMALDIIDNLTKGE